jgi:hypothetical protein
MFHVKHCLCNIPMRLDPIVSLISRGSHDGLCCAVLRCAAQYTHLLLSTSYISITDYHLPLQLARCTVRVSMLEGMGKMYMPYGAMMRRKQWGRDLWVGMQTRPYRFRRITTELQE